MKCPKCGKFLSVVSADITQENEVLSVNGICVIHGEVEPTDWEYEDFFPYPKIESEPHDLSTTQA